MNKDSENTAEHISKQWLICFDPDEPGQVPDRIPTGTLTRLPGAVIWGENDQLSLAYRDQPAITCIFNGYLYDIQALRTSLDVPDNLALSPAELALRAYMTWKEEAVNRIKGIFCWFIWDRDSQCFLCIRDRIGIYPLYFTRIGALYLFSDSIGSIFTYPGVSRDVNRVAIADHLCNHWPRMQETFYQDIQRVPPGSLMKLFRGQALISRYWYAIQNEDEVNWISADEVEQFDSLFEQAILRTMSVGPTSIFLSGGLDSVSVAALATDVARNQGFPDPLALSLIFPFPEVNEKEIQQGVATELGLSQVLLDLFQPGRENQFLDDAIEHNSYVNTIPLSLWRPGYHRLTNEAVLGGRRVILTGTGGDEWLTVSPTYASDLMSHLQFRELIRLQNQYIQSFNGPTWRLLYNGLWKYGLRPLAGRIAGDFLLSTSPGLIRKRRQESYLRHQPAWIAPDPQLIAEMARRIDETVENSIKAQHIKSLYIREMHTSLEHPLVAMELESAFELAQNFNMITLAPFQDADLVDFLYRTPPKFLIKDGMTKGLVRESLAKRFPNHGFEAQKKRAATGFFRHVLINQGKISWEKSRHAATLSSLGIIDPVKLNDTMQSIFSEKLPPNNAWIIWHILSLEGWTKRRTV